MSGAAIEVDADADGDFTLALMLDGVVGPNVRFNQANIWCLANLRRWENSAMATEVRNNEASREKAQAILELEGHADWWLNEDPLAPQPEQFSDLATSVLVEVTFESPAERPVPAQVMAEQHLEAAARLRDGWRP